MPIDLTQPLIWPSDDDVAARWRLVLDQLKTPRRGGGIAVVERGDPLWQGTFLVRNVLLDRAQAWQAWINLLRGGRVFVGVPVQQAYPVAHGRAVLTMSRAGGGAFDGTAALGSTAGDLFELRSLPAGLVLSAGDYLSVAVGGRWSLHQVIEGAVANGSGVAIVQVNPLPRAVLPTHPTNLVVQLVRPRVRMRLATDPPELRGDDDTVTTLEFTGVEI